MTFSEILDPDSRMSIQLDWSDWLADGETINQSTWSISGPSPRPSIEPDSDSIDSPYTRCWVEGGRERKYYELTNHVVTNTGWEDDRTVTLICEPK